MPADVVLRSLRHVWLTLEPLGVARAVAGGLALAAWKYVRATRDIDLLVGLEQTDLTQLLDRLQAAGIRSKRTPFVVRLGQLDVVQLLYEPPESFMEVQIDLLLAQSEYPHEALRRRVAVELPGLELAIAVLACEDLILHKLLAGRLIDRVDAAGLIKLNRGTLDVDYLNLWAQRLRLTVELAQAWKDASACDSPPGSSDAKRHGR